ncbi:hypothetical protein SD81_032150 [Tolypothrix campylonemoides VB511288]|nr:hypothetical protein SD81_032150 [Tolypothrix campylonemoides VB511288]
MSAKEDAMARLFFSSEEVTLTLPKRHLQRLYDVLQETSQTFEERLHNEDSLQNPKDFMKDRIQNTEDRGILTYLAWVLQQND